MLNAEIGSLGAQISVKTVGVVRKGKKTIVAAPRVNKASHNSISDLGINSETLT
jgi:hypothetical protein